MKKVYEAWQDDSGCGITFGPLETIEDERACGGLTDKAKLLHRVEADTFEEALAVHYIKMGWRPFVPVGEAQECPRGCGAMFYPEGSGECPNCGKIR